MKSEKKTEEEPKPLIEERFPAWLHLYDSELYVKCRKCMAWNNISFDLGEPSKYKPTPEKPSIYKCRECGATVKVDRVYFARKNMKKKTFSSILSVAEIRMV